MFTLGYETTFDGAHHLINYPGKCANLHGHTWKVRVELAGTPNHLGMVLDFGEIKQLMLVVVGKYDHQDLNTFLGQPTAENLAQRIFNDMTDELFRQGYKDVALITVTVWESPHAYCRVG